ncbi:hypothetical protein AVEN_223427-1 [Araneus ventricosus]|uniref:Uncharacterized protein n=1 Tax=Araneus ventricosus TaxID=182803 RepID=A0A4Y2RI01_ARAVE|nr:hypothetical protein AVEN_223427-1 [Araneus ventricosus]
MGVYSSFRLTWASITQYPKGWLQICPCSPKGWPWASPCHLLDWPHGHLIAPLGKNHALSRLAPLGVLCPMVTQNWPLVILAHRAGPGRLCLSPRLAWVEYMPFLSWPGHHTLCS